MNSIWINKIFFNKNCETNLWVFLIEIETIKMIPKSETPRTNYSYFLWILIWTSRLILWLYINIRSTIVFSLVTNKKFSLQFVKNITFSIQLICSRSSWTIPIIRTSMKSTTNSVRSNSNLFKNSDNPFSVRY